MTFNFLGPGLTVNVEAKVKEQIILDSSGYKNQASESQSNQRLCTICALSQSAAAALFAAFFVKPAGNLRCEVS